NPELWRPSDESLPRYRDALMDVSDWLGFTVTIDYLSALRDERERIFDRATPRDEDQPKGKHMTTEEIATFLKNEMDPLTGLGPVRVLQAVGLALDLASEQSSFNEHQEQMFDTLH